MNKIEYKITISVTNYVYKIIKIIQLNYFNNLGRLGVLTYLYNEFLASLVYNIFQHCV